MQVPQKLLHRVTEYFGNHSQAKIWFHIPNPVLNDMRPIDYKIGGNWKRLEKMIDDALKETDDERT